MMNQREQRRSKIAGTLLSLAFIDHQPSTTNSGKFKWIWRARKNVRLVPRYNYMETHETTCFDLFSLYF